MSPDGDGLAAARRLLPEGSQIRGQISRVPQPGVMGVFVALPYGLQGFVDVISLPRDTTAWPAEGITTEFEVLQHRRGQVRLWPLDPRYHHADPGLEAAWQQAKARHRVGSIATGEVTDVFPANHEYVIRLRGDSDHSCSAVLTSPGRQPSVGSVARYRITAHLDTTRRIIAILHDTSDGSHDH